MFYIKYLFNYLLLSHHSHFFLKKKKKLSAMDVLARASMKDAAKCDTHCELQISVNHQISERIWRCRDFPAARLFQCLLKFPSTTPPFLKRLVNNITTGHTWLCGCWLHFVLNIAVFFECRYLQKIVVI